MSKTKVHPPSPTQREALEKMAEAHGRLYRWPGGYWTTEPKPAKVRSEGSWGVPTWNVGTTTMFALEARGWVRRTLDFDEDWKDTRAITPQGLLAIGRGDDAGSFTVGEEPAPFAGSDPENQ